MTVDERLPSDVQGESSEGNQGESEDVIPLQRCPHLYIKYTPAKGKRRFLVATTAGIKNLESINTPQQPESSSRNRNQRSQN